MKCPGRRFVVALGMAGIAIAAAAAQPVAAANNKVLVYPSPGESVQQLRQRGFHAVRDYGSYWLVEATEEQLEALRASHGGRAIRANYLNIIELNATAVDTTKGEPPVPAELREKPAAGKRLRLVQFVGPVLPEWVEQLRAAGKVISYIPNNAYLVWLEPKAEQQLRRLLGPQGPIQWIGAYHPYYKLPRQLLKSTAETVTVRVAVVDGPETEQTIAALRSYSRQPVREPSQLQSAKLLRLVVNPSELSAIAQFPDVLWIEQVLPLQAHDEKQALILASRTSQLPGHAPVPGIDDYLNFLTNVVGFSTNSAEYPVIDVADTCPGPFRIGCPTVGIFRADFFEFGDTNNQFRLAGVVDFCNRNTPRCDGHATCVSSVAVGYNDSADPVNLDADGFRKGLGVSPFGRFAHSIIFKFVDPFCLVCDDDFDLDEGELPLNQYLLNRARIANNSWGERPVFGSGGNVGIYNIVSRAFDVSVRDAVDSGVTNGFSSPGPSPLNQEMIIVFAGGNTQGLDRGGFGDVLVTPPATAKNVISVGASENVRAFEEAVGECGLFADDADNSFDISFFSSFGPTLDGRFKPEIVAPGSAIFCADAFSDTNYVCASGTSFAAPAVSGGLQLLWWWFQNRLLNEQGQHLLQPSPAMAKAYLCSSARYLPLLNPQTGTLDTLPSIAQGMGIMDLERMFDGVPRILRDQSAPRAIDTPLLVTNPMPQQTYFNRSGQSYELTGQVADATKPFRVTLAWTDAPGNPAAFKQLVNDLDLEVTIGGKTYRGNVFVGPNSIATDVPNPRNVPDDINNMESVFLPPGSTGTWTVVVRATNIAGDGVPNVGETADQDFALVVYNAKLAPPASDVPNPSVNDACQTATLISRFPFTQTNTLSAADYHNVHPSPSAARGGVEQFFKIINPTPGTVFSADTFGSSFDTLLSVWKGDCGALLEVASNDNASNTLQSALSWIVTDTNTYYIVLEGRHGATGTAVLNVTTPGPQIVFEPAALDFGGQFVGTPSAVQTVTLRNNTPNRLNVLGVSVTGAAAADFQILSESCTGPAIPPGGFCEISVRFVPTATGPRSAALTVTDDATGSPRSVPLSGTGLTPAPLVCLGADSVSFGNQLVGTTGAVQSVLITNCGADMLFITNLTVTGSAAADFPISADSCSGVFIAPGSTCSVGIRFAPTSAGLRVAALRIVDNAAGSPHTVSLAGQGVSCPPIAVLPQLLPDAALGQAYSQTLTASAGTAPFTFLRTAGSLPPGLTLSSAGVISGTPTFLGSFTFKIRAVDANGCAGERVYTIRVLCPTITISPGSLPTGEVGQPYSVTFTATGGRPPHTFAQTAGSLPAGLTLSSSGVLSGIPTSGSSIFTVTATDADGCTGSATYLLILGENCPPISIAPTTLPDGTVSVAYSQTLSASGGTGPHTFSLALGTVPPGLELSSAGVISGTPTEAGTFTFTVRAADAFGCLGIRTYTVRICPLITLSPATLPPGTRGQSYSQTISASGGTAPHSFAVTSGALPAGLSLSGAGSLSGTPTVEGVFGFTVTATDADGCTGSRAYSLIINPAADLAVSKTGSPPTTVVGSNIVYTITVTNIGPSAATGVTATDLLPAQVSFLSASTGCVAVAGTVSCALGSLGAGSSTNVTIVTVAVATGSLTNTVSVAGNEIDPVAANNTAIATNEVGLSLLEFSAGSLMVSADAGQAVVTVARVGPAEAAVSVEYATEPGTAEPGVDYTPVAGRLEFEPGVTARAVSVPVHRAGAPGSKTVRVRLRNPGGGAALGARAEAMMRILNGLTGTSIRLADADGDVVTVSLKGAGRVEVVPAAGGIEQIMLSGTGVGSVLSISVKRGAAGDGFVNVGGIAGDGPVGRIQAAAVNLVGEGIELAGWLGALSVRDVLNGARVVAGGGAGQQTRIRAHVIGDGTLIRLGGVLRTLAAAQVGRGRIEAPCVEKVSVKGDARLGIHGTFAAQVTTTVPGCAPQLP